MRLNLPLLLVCIPTSLGLIAFGRPKDAPAPIASRHAPTYTADGKMNPPLDYREWIYLSSGLGMSYDPPMPSMSDHQAFDNVFVNPEAYATFKTTGHWPDHTTMVLELRAAASNSSINKAGQFQTQVTGTEVHVRDDARGGWAFYSFEGAGPGNIFPKTAPCYSCHQAHAAVDTTFVQFYPTLLPIANQKHTLSAEYVNEQSAHPNK